LSEPEAKTWIDRAWNVFNPEILRGTSG